MSISKLVQMGKPVKRLRKWARSLEMPRVFNMLEDREFFIKSVKKPSFKYANLVSDKFQGRRRSVFRGVFFIEVF